MKKIGLIILFFGFLLGISILLQLESLSVTMRPKKPNKSIENQSINLYEKRVAKYSSDMMEITRILYTIPLLTMLIGGLLASKQPSDKSLRKYLAKNRDSLLKSGMPSNSAQEKIVENRSNKKE
jgi:hypothetical protein